MKSLFLIILNIFIICYAADDVGVPVVNVIEHSRQYHSQDGLGQYSYGYSDHRSAKNEARSADGQTVGSYSFVDPNGKLQTVQYRSDPLKGFQVSATNLPQAPAPIAAPALILPEPVKDTPEVVSARAQHLEFLEHANEKLAAAAAALPEPVKDTPEVAEAKAKHLETFRETKEALKKAAESVSFEVKSSIQPHPAVITAASSIPVALLMRTSISSSASAPLFFVPSFGYSYGINHAGLYSVNAFNIPSLAYTAAPQAYIAAAFQSTTNNNNAANNNNNEENNGALSSKNVDSETVEIVADAKKLQEEKNKE